ncbi:hypothetical protein AVEN_43907-1 [Araneus ventricosus]|uniref:Helitron helicase-like domain-containing protein n=1 Tax=Araneus ventricosus TaxID=182803 RepID=A0A4Y2PSG6_ARAVE|nr:hypothetical protein AVEN_171704-1 [Araneus ventricosus]GBN54284.1 hypothetical protein AVEN_43907-1 [Araneus ventricosus]
MGFGSQRVQTHVTTGSSVRANRVVFASGWLGFAKREPRQRENREREQRRREAESTPERELRQRDNRGSYERRREAESTPERESRQIIGDSAEAKHFLTNVRRYYSCFHMTSFGTTKETRESGRWSQQAEQRCKNVPQTRQDVVLQLQDMLNHHNCYVHSFKSAMKIKVVILADKIPNGEHERRFNAPTTDEVTLIMIGEQHGGRDIILEKRSGTVKKIPDTYRSYNALQYPLIFW